MPQRSTRSRASPGGQSGGRCISCLKTSTFYLRFWLIVWLDLVHKVHRKLAAPDLRAACECWSSCSISGVQLPSALKCPGIMFCFDLIFIPCTGLSVFLSVWKAVLSGSGGLFFDFSGVAFPQVPLSLGHRFRTKAGDQLCRLRFPSALPASFSTSSKRFPRQQFPTLSLF